MLYTRRDVGRIALAAGAAGRLMAAKPNSNFGGVQIGTITYSFRSMPGSAEETLKYCLEVGVSGIEMMGNVAETYVGVQQAGRGGFGGPGAPGRGPGGGAPGQGRQGGGGRAALTPEQQEARRKAAEETRTKRLAVKMGQYKDLRKMYEDAGVKIYALKIPPTLEMSDGEYEYIWNAAETLGASHITMELPANLNQTGELVWNDELLQRVAAYAAKRKFRIAFHAHGQGGEKGFQKALDASTYTALNLDVGHFYGVNGADPTPVMVKYHDRIASLHLKDRKGPNSADPNGRGGPGGGGPNMPWGQGETPLKEVLQTMKKNKYKFPASIEYEYNTPEGSSVLAEVRKCVDYCKAALA